MVLLTLTLITLIVLAIIAVITTLVGGIGLIVTFGDLIVFALVIVWIIKKILKKKRGR